MQRIRLGALAFAMTFTYCQSLWAADSSGAAPASDSGGVAPAAPDDKTQTLQTIEITQKLQKAREELEPDIGGSVYKFDSSDIDLLPMGDATTLNQVMLQAPGVVQDSFGQLHVRGDHANIQFRIDGIIIPEAITGFGQSLDTRFANSIDLLTGALPAEYGYRTAGVISITTKGSPFENGGEVSLTGGSLGDREGGLELTGNAAGWNYFVEGSMLRNNDGIENPTDSRDPLHDATDQTKGFVYLSRVLDNGGQLTIMAGSTSNRFQIPDNPNQVPQYTLYGAVAPASADLNARQDEKNQFQVLAYQSSPSDTFNYQIDLFHRYTDAHYQPDAIGDLVYNGVAADILRKNDAVGMQGDASDKINDAHTLRAGFFVEHESYLADNTSVVFPANAGGMQTSESSEVILDNNQLQGVTWGGYVQDEWQPTKALTVNYGVRYDHTDTVTDAGQLSPRVGMVYELSATTQLHAGYARYFTPPPTESIDLTSIEKFQNTTNALPTNSNTAVEAMRSNYFDVGVLHEWTPSLSTGVDIYYRRDTDLQDEGQFGNALIFSAFNYAEGRVAGIEFSGSYREGNLSAYANLAINAAEGKDIVTGQYNFSAAELDYISDHWIHLDHDQTFTSSGGVSYRWGPTTYSVDYLSGSGLRAGFANELHVPEYIQVDANAVHHFNFASIGQVDLRLTIVNVFDRVYEIRDGTGVGVGAPQWGPRRGFFATVVKYF